MFPRAARFNRDKLSDTPGPNAYDPTEMVPHYKKGLLNQKDARFKAGQQQQDFDDGASTSSAATATTSAQSSILNAAALKEKAKLASRLTKSEERVKELERQVHSLTNEKSQSLAELRISQQQVEKLQTQLSKTKGQISRSDSSQAKLAELQRSLDQSKNKEKLEVEKWSSKYSSLQDEKKQIEADWMKARAAIASYELEVQVLREREADLLRQLAIEREGRRQAEESAADERAKMEELEILSHRMQQQQNSLARGLADLHNKFEEGQNSLQEQSSQRTALERVARDYAVQMNELHGQKRASSLDNSLERIQIRRRRVNVEVQEMDLHHSRALITDLEENLQRERQQCQDVLLQLDEALSGRDTSITLEPDDSSHIEKPFEGQEEKALLLETSESLRIASELALQEERERSERLDGDIDELQVKYLGALQEVGTMKETQQSLEKVREELESVEEAYEKGLLEAMRAHKGEEEAKRQVSQCRAENEELKAKLRQMEKTGQKLFHAKMKEGAWLQEREELLQAVERGQHYESEYEKLRSQAHILLSKSTLYAGQMEELASLNTILASHTNPSQKIFYLDRIRKELDEKRLECQVLTVERDQFKAVSKDLQVKLDLFCKVESRLEDRPKTAFKRVARQSPGHTTTTSSNSNGVLAERSPNKRSSPVKGSQDKRSSPLKVRKHLNHYQDVGEMRINDLTRGI